MANRFDLVVIGAGAAGERGAAQAAFFGKRVAVIEREPEPGGALVHTGTLPSKTLRETALFVSGFHARKLYGVQLELPAETQLQALMSRKKEISAAESARIRHNLARHEVTLLRGQARFTGLHTLSVTAPDGAVSELEADHVLIATGSRPVRPAELNLDDPEIYDSTEILELDRTPRSLVVLGAGVIGSEYACMFAALGVEVTLIDARRPFLEFLDPELTSTLRTAMERLGVRFEMGTKWREVARQPSGKVRTVLTDGREFLSDKVLFAAGRSGNTADLGLETIGLVPNARGHLEVDDCFRTKVPHVLAAGDVIGFPALASVSMEQARVAVCRAFGFGYKQRVSALLPYGLYTIPEVSSVGETEASCAARNLPISVGRARFAENARGRISGDTEGFVKLVCDQRDGRLIGCHVIGERATELVHIGQLAIQLGASVEVFLDMVFNTPTLSETFKYAAYDALKGLGR